MADKALPMQRRASKPMGSRGLIARSRLYFKTKPANGGRPINESVRIVRAKTYVDDVDAKEVKPRAYLSDGLQKPIRPIAIKDDIK